MMDECSGIRDLLGPRDSNPSYCLSDDAIFTYDNSIRRNSLVYIR
jgi:hypothetical protein